MLPSDIPPHDLKSADFSLFLVCMTTAAEFSPRTLHVELAIHKTVADDGHSRTGDGPVSLLASWYERQANNRAQVQVGGRRRSTYEHGMVQSAW